MPLAAKVASESPESSVAHKNPKYGFKPTTEGPGDKRV